MAIETLDERSNIVVQWRKRKGCEMVKAKTGEDGLYVDSSGICRRKIAGNAISPSLVMGPLIFG
jgi:hypothetical protein